MLANKSRKLLLKLSVALALLILVGMKLYSYFEVKAQRKEIAAAIDELKSYREVLQSYYQTNGHMPRIGKVFPKVINPLGRSGCDVAGVCATYYERSLGNPKLAFMSKTIVSKKKPNRVFVAFMERDKEIITYCGPWAKNNEQSVPADELPASCSYEIREILGL